MRELGLALRIAAISRYPQCRSTPLTVLKSLVDTIRPLWCVTSGRTIKAVVKCAVPHTDSLVIENVVVALIAGSSSESAYDINTCLEDYWSTKARAASATPTLSHICDARRFTIEEDFVSYEGTSSSLFFL